MPNLMIVARESKALAKLRTALNQNGFACSIAPPGKEVTELLASQPPDLLLIEADSHSSDSESFIHGIKLERSPPVIALVAGEMPDDIEGYLEVDDFLTSPYDVKELVVRVQRLLRSGKRANERASKSAASGELIECDNLVIDLTNCDVTVGGKVVELTFKEYELLKLLAANKGRVYSRQNLLNKIWGYEYYGGDRTVDVHVRRLRSKIEGPNDTFIETVRNMGYRFKKG